MISPRTADETTRPNPKIWNVREADGRADAFYLVRQWHHYFGVEYESNWLPYGPYQVAGWDDEDEEEDLREAFGVIATHDVDPSYLATHQFSLEDSPRGYEMFREKEDGCVRSVFAP
ncbi:hypothetical protein HYG81_22430 (plasmid) [Natrinema zhouii]|uniref:hypothetical protein n=1 Tax=Natrinema zhouii TaxID=1710539 RepID=UPI001CFFC8A4|nr:hypothetical protein [Natrinema zhouii]UHQ98818.1 hypothetical protein HYG81_22430 [Natrinema zhouii]